MSKRADRLREIANEMDDEAVTAQEEYADLERQLAAKDDEIVGLKVAISVLDADAERLHEAICDGRQQDAIDILNEATGLQLRSVREQANLFLERVQK